MDLSGDSFEHLRNKRAKRSSQIENKNLQEFFGDFQPDKSRREKRKLKLKMYGGMQATRTAYDENGLLRVNETDMCDCMIVSCPGCFFPCPNCKCTKCGPTCRVNRKHAYQCIEIDGQKTVIQFKYKQY